MKLIILLACAAVLVAQTGTTLVSAQAPSSGEESHVLPESQPGVKTAIGYLKSKYANQMNQVGWSDTERAAETVLNDVGYLSKLRRQQAVERANNHPNYKLDDAIQDADRILLLNMQAMFNTVKEYSDTGTAVDLRSDVSKQALANGLVYRGEAIAPTRTTTTTSGRQTSIPKVGAITTSDYNKLAAHADALPSKNVETKNRFYHLAMQAAIKIAKQDHSSAQSSQAKAFLKALPAKFKAIESKLPDDGARQMCGMDIEICKAMAGG